MFKRNMQFKVNIALQTKNADQARFPKRIKKHVQ